MKKLVIIFLTCSLLILVLFAIINNSKIKNNGEKNEQKNQNEQIQNNDSNNNKDSKNNYIDDNPVKVGLYTTVDSKRQIVKQYKNNWVKKKDIETFTTLFTTQENVSNGYLQNVFYEYYNKFENPSNYKIGYKIKFEIEGGEILEKTILSPKDTQYLYEYLETYLYNGPQKKIGQWYSHVTEEEYNENTILASIKLTAGSKIEKIISDIELTVFTYNGNDDFDEKNNYRGSSSYTINIEKK
ncbi:MAG TPA: hypothetical protein PK993_00520 [Clostridia bacterium]|jgi:hypothetical protein|nr:hypothetical protein [Clostridia bacterium]